VSRRLLTVEIALPKKVSSFFAPEKKQQWLCSFELIRQNQSYFFSYKIVFFSLNKSALQISRISNKSYQPEPIITREQVLWG